MWHTGPGRGDRINSANAWPRRLTIEATLNLPSSARAIRVKRGWAYREPVLAEHRTQPDKSRNPGTRAGIWISVDS